MLITKLLQKDKMSSEDWYEVIQHKDHLIIIRERLDKIDPRYLTTYTNLYLIVGNEACLLIDTGCGLFPLKSVIEKFLNQKKLIVVNTHSHFDHIGANGEFEQIFIHKNEEGIITKPIDLSFLKDSPNTIVNRYTTINWMLPAASKVSTLYGGETFNLGGIKVECVHSPGHSPGSISLYTDRGELFTGDLAHYGTMFLPPKENLSLIIESINKLIDLNAEKNMREIYPSHEDYGVSKDLLIDLSAHLKNINNIWETRTLNIFNNAWEINAGKFKLLIKVGRKEQNSKRI